jgi:hypothetical protein
MHRYLWFPYRLGQQFLVLVILVLVFCTAATGLTKQLQVFTRIELNKPSSPSWSAILLIFALNVALMAYYAKTDYTSLKRSLLPVISSTSIICLVSFILTALWTAAAELKGFPIESLMSKPFLHRHAAEASLSALAFTIIVNRFVQSSGVDLSQISRLCKQLLQTIDMIIATKDLQAETLVELKKSLMSDAIKLAGLFREACSEVFDSSQFGDLPEVLESLAKWTAVAEDGRLISALEADEHGVRKYLRGIC